MTSLALPSVAGRPVISLAAVRRAAPGLMVGLAVGYLTMPFAQATGGRGPWALSKAAIVVAAALVAVKPWEHLPARVLALSVAVSGAALAVCLLTSPGWFGATRAASYGLAAATFVAVVAYARSVRRTYMLATIVAASGVAQFAWSFLAWWGGRQSSALMVGTFYWHNQFAAFLVGPALIGLSLVIARRAPWRSAGWVVAPLGVAGVVHSSSRGGMAVLLGGWLVMGILAARARADRGMLRRWIAASALAIGVTVAVSGPPFFASSASPFAGVQNRAAAGETAEGNGQFRLYMWRESVSVFESAPLAGVGYGGFASAAAKVTPADWPRSSLVHNDYLQPLAEGGLLLGVPFIGACALIGAGLIRMGRQRARRRVVDVRTGLIVASFALMAHAAIDFDWSYPALLTLAAVVTALAVAPAIRRPGPRQSDGETQDQSTSDEGVGARLRVTLVAALASTVVAGAVAGHVGGLHLNYRGAPSSTTSTLQGAAGR